MARQSRLILPHQPHYVVQRGNDNQPVFRDDDDYARFLGWLKDAAKAYKVAIHGWVLMPNQLHLLATPSDEDGLAGMMQKVGRLYVPWFNTKHGRSGTLFGGRFRTSLVDPAQYFLPSLCYLELLPVRSQAASAPVDYPWSSHAHHAGVRADGLITDHARYWGLGNTPFQREAAYTALAQQGLNADEFAAIDSAVARGVPLGSHAFLVELERKTQRQVLPAKRGRPFKAEAGE